MAFEMADIAYYFMFVMFIMVAVAAWNTFKDDTEDERIRKYLKKRVGDIFKSRMQLLAKEKGKQILWRDHEGNLTRLGWSNHFGVYGSGQYMIFFKKGANLFKIFPNIFEDHLCIRALIGNVTKLGTDTLIVQALGFETRDRYWYTVTNEMNAQDIKELISKDRDLLLADELMTEMVKIAKTKVDSSILHNMAIDDIGDMEGQYSNMKLLEDSKGKGNN